MDQLTQYIIHEYLGNLTLTSPLYSCIALGSRKGKHELSGWYDVGIVVTLGEDEVITARVSVRQPAVMLLSQGRVLRGCAAAEGLRPAPCANPLSCKTPESAKRGPILKYKHDQYQKYLEMRSGLGKDE